MFRVPGISRSGDLLQEPEERRGRRERPDPERVEEVGEEPDGGLRRVRGPTSVPGSHAASGLAALSQRNQNAHEDGGDDAEDDEEDARSGPIRRSEPRDLRRLLEEHLREGEPEPDDQREDEVVLELELVGIRAAVERG